VVAKPPLGYNFGVGASISIIEKYIPAVEIFAQP